MANQKSIISSKDVYNIIRKAFEAMDVKIMQHGQITGYIFYKMLQAEGIYNEHELANYTMIGLMHDIGMVKTGYEEGIVKCETSNVWAHSVYGYLFFRYLSPLADKAEIVLYHHLPYYKHSLINSKYLKIVEYLTLADKMDVFMRMSGHGMEKDYFVSNSNIEFSARAMEMFNRAQAKFNFMQMLKTGEYTKELDELLTKSNFTENDKRGYLEMLAYAIDFRSQQTVVHTLATMTFAVELGRFMRVSAADLQILYYGALFHDFGKIKIPLEILEAPRRLSNEEMDLMKTHVNITEQILRNVIDNTILEVAIRHHEKLDGSGYHRGLSEKELTTLQRIVAVADILSALYGKRSYKEAFDSQKIKDIMQSDADNGKICSKTVDILMNNFDTIISNYEKKRETTMGIYMTMLNDYDKIYEKFKVFEQ